MNRRAFFRSALIGGGTAFLASRAYSLKFFPNPSKNKWAIVYGTRYGSNRDASVWISEGMGAIADVFDARENPNLSSYDYLVVGSGIYGSRVAQPLESFIKDHLDIFSKKVQAVFVVCGAGEAAYTQRYLHLLTELCQAQPVLQKSFPGRVTKKLLSPEDFKILENYYKSIGQPFEDYDHMQRKDFLLFGEDIIQRFPEK